MQKRQTGGELRVGNMVNVEGGTLPDIGNGKITVSSFSIGKYPVTLGEWQEVRAWAAHNGYDVGDRGEGSGDKHPVHSVSWYDVVKRCNARSEMEGHTPVYMVGGAVYRSGEDDDVSVDAGARGYRLPTDSEWEYAARGGNRSKGYRYRHSGSDDVEEVAWYEGNSSGAEVDIHEGRGTWPVGQKAANELGLYDMIGNVWEWCFDLDPDPSFMGSYRVFRGGSWGHYANCCRSAYRGYGKPDLANDYIGFRVACPQVSEVS